MNLEIECFDDWNLSVELLGDPNNQIELNKLQSNLYGLLTAIAQIRPSIELQTLLTVLELPFDAPFHSRLRHLAEKGWLKVTVNVLERVAAS